MEFEAQSVGDVGHSCGENGREFGREFGRELDREYGGTFANIFTPRRGSFDYNERMSAFEPEVSRRRVGSDSAVVLLDSHTINQIAAGEVVERPASVVKELVENALDAGATRISIEIRDVGRELIVVSDDGCGMSQEDAMRSLQRHATSKIRSVDDLQRTSSLGFRGEAIPSIASVSSFRMSTAAADGLRTVVNVEYGEVGEIEFEPGPRGTEIRVADLFARTPARLKFLKSDSTELGAISELVGKYAVSFPDVGFKLRHGKAALIETSGDGDSLGALASVWNREIVRALAEINLFHEGVRVRGYVSGPNLTKPTRSMQWLFVNGRPVKNRSLMSSIDAAFRQLTPDRRFPIALILIDVEPGKVDMNVSPTKSEVRFSHERQVFDTMRRAIKDALMAAGMMPSLADIARANEAMGGQSAYSSGRIPGSLYGSGTGSGEIPGSASAAAYLSSPTPGNVGLTPLGADDPLRSVHWVAESSALLEPGIGTDAQAEIDNQRPSHAHPEAFNFRNEPLWAGPREGEPLSVEDALGLSADDRSAANGEPQGYSAIQGAQERDPFDVLSGAMIDGTAAPISHDDGLTSMAAMTPIVPVAPVPPGALESGIAGHRAGSQFADRFLDGLRIFGQTADCFFILCENRSGVMIIDQHVAHERILFEAIRDRRSVAPIERQPLLEMDAVELYSLDLDRRTADRVLEHLDDLRAAGFELEPFGSSTFLVRGVPAMLRRHDPIRVLRDLIDDLVDGTRGSGLTIRENVWVMCACKMAIKAGDKLSFAEMQKLLTDLAFTENPYLCPHGRPITLMLTSSELKAKFKR